MSSGGSGSDWCTIESDPGVFTCLIESFGVRNAELAELWSLDDDSLQQLCNDCGGVFGLVFLFKWKKELEQAFASGSTRKPLAEADIPESLFFARQTVTNACATQAILSILFNAADRKEDAEKKKGGIELGSTLTEFRSFTSSFPPYLRGEAIGSSEDIRTAHNAFARNDPFVLSDEEKARRMRERGEDDDVFHFVAYIPHPESGNVYELDGLREGPVLVGSYTKPSEEADGDVTMTDASAAESKEGERDSDMPWLRVARGAIQERIERYSSAEIKFNLMAVVRDRRLDLQQRLEALSATGASLDDPDSVVGEEAAEIKARLAAEEEKRAQWATENERRRHNYVPFCVELLKCLARSGKLPELTEQAKERAAALRKRRQAEQAGTK